MPTTPQRGDFVRVRTRRWLVEDERSVGDGLTSLRLACVDDDAQGEVVEVLCHVEDAPDSIALGVKFACSTKLETFRKRERHFVLKCHPPVDFESRIVI